MQEWRYLAEVAHNESGSSGNDDKRQLKGVRTKGVKGGWGDSNQIGKLCNSLLLHTASHNICLTLLHAYIVSVLSLYAFAGTVSFDILLS